MVSWTIFTVECFYCKHHFILDTPAGPSSLAQIDRRAINEERNRDLKFCLDPNQSTHSSSIQGSPNSVRPIQHPVIVSITPHPFPTALTARAPAFSTALGFGVPIVEFRFILRGGGAINLTGRFRPPHFMSAEQTKTADSSEVQSGELAPTSSSGTSELERIGRHISSRRRREEAAWKRDARAAEAEGALPPERGLLDLFDEEDAREEVRRRLADSWLTCGDVRTLCSSRMLIFDPFPSCRLASQSVFLSEMFSRVRVFVSLLPFNLQGPNSSTWLGMSYTPPRYGEERKNKRERERGGGAHGRGGGGSAGGGGWNGRSWFPLQHVKETDTGTGSQQGGGLGGGERTGWGEARESGLGGEIHERGKEGWRERGRERMFII